MLTNVSGSLSILLPRWRIRCSLSLSSSLALQLPVGPMQGLGCSPQMLLDFRKHCRHVPVTLWWAWVVPALFAFPAAAQRDWRGLCQSGGTKLNSPKEGMNPEHQGEKYVELIYLYNSRARGRRLVLRSQLALTSKRCLSEVGTQYILFHHQFH